MLVDITIVHAASVVPKRKRKPENGLFSHTFPVEIEELSSSDCPLAFWLGDTSKPTEIQVAWRRDGDAFLSPVPGTTEGSGALRVSPLSRKKKNIPPTGAMGKDAVYDHFAGLVYGREDAYTSFSTLDLGGRRKQSSLPKSMEESNLGKIESSERDRVAAMVAEVVAKRHVLVDGFLHFRGGPPTILLDGYSSSIRTGETDLSSLRNSGRIRYAGAMRSARDIRDAGGERAYVPPTEVKQLLCDVVDEAATEFDEARYLLAIAARSLVRSAKGASYDKSPIADASKETMTAFVRVRDMMKAEFTTPELLDAVREFIQVAGRLSYHFDLDRVADVVATAEKLLSADKTQEYVR
jgi:hypothetical protein